MSLKSSGITDSSSLRIAVSTVERAVVERKIPVGSTLSARILESHGDGKFTVGFAGLKMIAESTLSLGVGQRVYVRVESHDPKIHLRLIEAKPEGRGFDELRRLAPGISEKVLRELARALAELGLPPESDTLRRAAEALKEGVTPRAAARFAALKAPLSEALAARARASGNSVSAALERLTAALRAEARAPLAEKIEEALLFRGDMKELFEKHPLKMERRMLGADPASVREDAKAALIEISREKSGEAPTESARAAKELLEMLEGRYLMGDPDPAIPFLVEDEGFRDAELSAERSPDRAFVRLRLDTSRLGLVLGVIDARKNRLGISLGVPGDEARQEMRQALPKLLESLKALGFETDSVTVDVVRRKPGDAEEASGFDVRI